MQIWSILAKTFPCSVIGSLCVSSLTFCFIYVFLSHCLTVHSVVPSPLVCVCVDHVVWYQGEVSALDSWLSTLFSLLFVYSRDASSARGFAWIQMLQIADTFGSLRHWSYASSLDNTINLSYQDLSGCSAHRMVCSALDCHYSTEAKETTALVAELQLPAVETKGASLWRWHRPLCYCWFLQTVPGLLHQLLDNFVIALCDKKLIKLWRVSYQFYFPLHHWGVTLIRSAEGCWLFSLVLHINRDID